MNKAEERALERCPKSENLTEELRNERKRAIFTEGYHQAEKDLELTWEDIELIVNIDQDTNNEESIIGVRKNEEHYQEVLKRFKDLKNN